MIPKCSEFIPNDSQIGRKIGVNIIIAGMISMNVPTNRRNTFKIRRITTGLSLIPRSIAEIASGIPVNDSTHPMMLDVPHRKMMIPVLFALSFKIAHSSFRSMVL